MSLAEALYEKVSTDAGIVALVATRISPDLRRANESLPAIVFIIEDEERIPLLTLAQVTYTARARFECMADQLADAYQISEAVIACLHGLSNYASSGTVVIRQAVFVTRSEIGLAPEPPPNDTDMPRVVTVEFFLSFTI